MILKKYLKLTQSKTETVEFSLEKDNQNPLTINFYSSVSTESCMVLATMLKKWILKQKN